MFNTLTYFIKSDDPVNELWTQHLIYSLPIILIHLSFIDHVSVVYWHESDLN